MLVSGTRQLWLFCCEKNHQCLLHNNKEITHYFRKYDDAEQPRTGLIHLWIIGPQRKQIINTHEDEIRLPTVFSNVRVQQIGTN